MKRQQDIGDVCVCVCVFVLYSLCLIFSCRPELILFPCAPTNTFIVDTCIYTKHTHTQSLADKSLYVYMCVCVRVCVCVCVSASARTYAITHARAISCVSSGPGGDDRGRREKVMKGGRG